MAESKLAPPLRKRLDEIIDLIFDKAALPIWSYDDGTNTIRRRPLTVPMLATRAGLTATTVRRLMNRLTEFPRWDTVEKLLLAVSMEAELYHSVPNRDLPVQTVSIRQFARLKRMAA